LTLVERVKFPSLQRQKLESVGKKNGKGSDPSQPMKVVTGTLLPDAAEEGTPGEECA